MKIVLRSVAFSAICAGCIALGLFVPGLIGNGSVESAGYGIIYGAFGVFMGPVVAAIAVFPRFRGRHPARGSGSE